MTPPIPHFQNQGSTRARKTLLEDSHMSQHKLIELLTSYLDYPRRNQLAIPTPEGCDLVQIQEIVRLEAEGNYTRLYMQDKSKILVSKTLMEYQKQLEKHGFFRIHRSHLINLSYLRRFYKGKHPQVVLSNGDTLTVSKRKKEAFVGFLNAKF